MKVSLATQLFSNSVSAAITFLRNLKLKSFEDSKPTIDFVRLMNDKFDMLNSKSKFGKYTKQPIDRNNFFDIESKLKDGIEFLKTLKDTSGLPLIKGPREFPVIGFSNLLILPTVYRVLSKKVKLEVQKLIQVFLIFFYHRKSGVQLFFSTSQDILSIIC